MKLVMNQVVNGGEAEIELTPSSRNASEGRPESREGRVRQPPSWMDNYVLGDELEEGNDCNMALIVSTDPLYFEEVVKSQKWRLAMDEEIISIEKYQTWRLVELPVGAKKIGVKWVFKTKLNEQGKVDKYKARLVVKGYAQEYGVDYTEVYAPVARMDTVRMVIALAENQGSELYQLDVKFAFLYGELNKDVYVEQPKGYVKRGSEHKVYKLCKSLYGLKHAPKAWFSQIESYFIREGFQKNHGEQTLFVKRNYRGNILIVSVYVDDLLYTGNDESMLNEFKNSMKQEFDMTNLGKMRFFLGIEVLQRSNGVYIS